MNLTELQDEVKTLTNRPDLTAQTLLAVRSATLKIHQSDYFYKDLFETGIDFTTEAYVQQLDYRVLLPRWRAFKYLRKTDSTGTEQGVFFDLIVPENVLDDYHLNRVNVCYAAGQVIQIKAAEQFRYGILGCYLNPDITVSNYDSWVALDHPYAIVFEAAASVFKMIGDTDQFSAYTTLATQQLIEVRNSNISAKGE